MKPLPTSTPARERLRYALQRLGWPALLGLALAAGAAVIDLGLADDLETRIAELRQSRHKLRSRLAVEAAKGDSQGLQVEQLVERDAIDPVINGIHAAAQKNGVRLEQGEYRLQAETGTRLGRYRIAFPAKGSYPQLRAWLDDALAARAGLVVEELSLRREDIANDSLEARVGLVLLVRSR